MILFLNGWGASAKIWPQELVRRDCTYVDFSELGRVEELERLLEQLPAGERVTLVGWSLGGMVALNLASRYGARVDRLFLLSTTACFVRRGDYTQGLRAANIHWLLRNLRKAPRQTQLDFCRGMFTPGEEQACQRLLEQEPLVDKLEALEWGLEYLEQQDWRQLLPELRVPTYIIHGHEDSICPWGAATYLAEQLPQAQLFGLEGAGHAPFLTRPELYARLLFGEEGQDE